MDLRRRRRRRKKRRRRRRMMEKEEEDEEEEEALPCTQPQMTPANGRLGRIGEHKAR